MTEEFLINRPDMAQVSRMFGAAHKVEDSRERARSHAAIFNHICSHYEQYIKSITMRLAELERTGTMLAEVIEVKRLVIELSKNIGVKSRD